MVGGDVVDGVGCDFRRVDDDVAGECAVQIGLDAEVEVGSWRSLIRMNSRLRENTGDRENSLNVIIYCSLNVGTMLIVALLLTALPS